MAWLDTMSSVASILGSLAAVIGIPFAVSQLWVTRGQAVTTFEDAVADRYLEFVRELPVEAFLDGELSEDALAAHLAIFYRYFVYSNWQAFLHLKRRVRAAVWAEWRAGIEENLRRPAFAAAWRAILARRPGEFDDLRRAVVVPE